MKAYTVWLEDEVKALQSEYDCTRAEALEIRDFGYYWTDYIQPLLAQGEQVPHTVAKVLAKHDRLWYVQKFYPEQALNVELSTGNVINTGSSFAGYNP